LGREQPFIWTHFDKPFAIKRGYEKTSEDLRKLDGFPDAIFKRLTMRAAEKNLIERNLDLIFEFEKYVLEHPEISEKIPRDAVVFMKVRGDQKFNRWSERQAKKQAKNGAPLVSVTVKKMGPVHSRIKGLALEYAA